jgi:hypothetical protein
MAVVAWGGAAQAATLQSGSAFFEQTIANPVNQFYSGPQPLGASGTATVSVAQFDPIFGTLTGVDLVFDVTSAMNFIARLPNFGATVTYDTGLSVTAGGETTSVLDFRQSTFQGGANTMWFNFNAFDRSFARVLLGDLTGFVGTGNASFDLTATQDILRNDSNPLQFSGFVQPIAELAASVSVEYHFTPGVQTVEVQAAMLRFSSAFVPEIAAQRADLPAVPLPASAWLLLGAIAASGAVLRRRRA